MVASPASSWIPAWPSSAALKLRFSIRSASGLSWSISSHHFTVSSSRRASGTTAFTSPMESACWASYWRQRNQISFAFFRPTMLASVEDPNPPSKLPTRGPVWPKRALSAAMVRSQTTWSTCPPPMAYPATIATTGFGSDRICFCRSRTFRRGTPSRPTYPCVPRMRWSPPEQNASFPAPVRMATPVSGSSRTSSKHFCNSNSVCGRKALRTSGRLMVILAIPLPDFS